MLVGGLGRAKQFARQSYRVDFRVVMYRDARFGHLLYGSGRNP